MPGSKPYRLHALAWQEIEGADDWYRQHSEDAATDFVAEVFTAIRKIREAPHRWPSYLHGTRRYVLDRFPFSILYLETSELVNIVAVAHSKRKPGYWRRRL
jgi:plasmid stabilization system protein ParE